MKHSQTLLAFAGFTIAMVSTVARAQAQVPLGFEPWMMEAASSMKTRAEVLAELKQSRADGSIRSTAPDYDFAAASRAMKTRAQVMHELQQARMTGEFAASNAEAHAFDRAPQPLVARR